MDMTWKDINVFQYQQIMDLYATAKDMSELDLAYKITAIVMDLTENQIDSLPMDHLKPLLQQVAFVHEQIKPQPQKYIQVNGKRYRCIYDIRKMPAARYIESKHFDQDRISNLHKLAACMTIPQKRNWLGMWVDDTYDAGKHSEYADDMLAAPITAVLGSVVFFLSSIQQLDKEFKGLFDKGDDDEGDDQISGRENIHPFMRNYGWIYQAKLVAEHEGIILEKAFDLNTLQFLNNLAYIKAKNEYDREQLKKVYGKV